MEQAAIAGGTSTERGTRDGEPERRDRVGMLDPAFSLGRHLGLMALIAGSILGLGGWLARGATVVQWAWLPVCWVVANFFEWAFHRYPMHRPMGPRVLYKNHSLIHHRAFHAEDMPVTEVRELSLVMMPWYTLLLVFVMAAPIAGLFALLGGRALAGIFVVASVGYFALYESLHTHHHLTPRRGRLGPLGRLLAFVRDHHAHHHRPERMSKVNFNVTFPLADWVMGTYERGPDR